VDEIYLKLHTSTSPPLTLIDFPRLDQQIVDDSTTSDYAEHCDAIILVVVPASQAPEISLSQALKLALEIDVDGTRNISIISKINQATTDQKILVVVQELLLGQGPRMIPRSHYRDTTSTYMMTSLDLSTIFEFVDSGHDLILAADTTTSSSCMILMMLV